MVTKDNAFALCKRLYEELAPIGVFPALTGGLLYKNNSRKDIDIVLYGHRNRGGRLEVDDVLEELEGCGLVVDSKHGFVTKATWYGLEVDILIPESRSGVYEVKVAKEGNPLNIGTPLPWEVL